MKDGSFVVDGSRRKKYEAEACRIDPNAEFQYGVKFKIFHSFCGTWRTMEAGFSLTKFRTHVRDCTGPKTRSRKSKEKTSSQTPTVAENETLLGWALQSSTKTSKSTISIHETPSLPLPQPKAQQRTLDFFMKRSITAPPAQEASASRTQKRLVSSKSEPLVRPCQGITAAFEPSVVRYLSRTPAAVGGSNSVSAIAQELFGMDASYASLGPDEKEEADLVHLHRKTWRNDHTLQAVFSLQCLQTVTVSSEDEHAICANCRSVHRQQSFRVALSKKPRPLKNMRHLNKVFANNTLPAVKYYVSSQGLEDLLKVASLSPAPHSC